MFANLSLGSMKLLALVLLGVGMGLFAAREASPSSAVSRLWGRYVAYLDRGLRALFLPESGRRIAMGQVAAMSAVVLLQVSSGIPVWPIWGIVIAVSPVAYLHHERDKRIERIEGQIDAFIVSLANALKTVPNPGAALEATTMVLASPMKQEIEQVLAEMRVGSTLEQGLIAMSARLRSKSVDVAVSTVLIGLRVGGNLPLTLERTAGAIREMNRLLGVVRTKTGEGRMQLWVLVFFPVFAVGVMDFVQPGYFAPLEHTLYGQIAVSVAVVFWLAALVVARNVLAVDI